MTMQLLYFNAYSNGSTRQVFRIDSVRKLYSKFHNRQSRAPPSSLEQMKDILFESFDRASSGTSQTTSGAEGIKTEAFLNPILKSLEEHLEIIVGRRSEKTPVKDLMNYLTESKDQVSEGNSITESEHATFVGHLT